MNTTIKPKHIGRNIGRIRELRGMKQEALAIAIGSHSKQFRILKKVKLLKKKN